MARSSLTRVACCGAVAAAFVARSASAAAPSACDSPQLNVVAPPDPKWDATAARLGRHLRGLSDLDRCARVTVKPDATGVTLRVTTSDGREAERHVENLDALLTAAEALLVLPPTRATSDATVSPLEVPPRDPEPVRVAPSSAHVELGGAGTVRFGGSPAYVGAGAMAFAGFVLDRWLLSVAARFDVKDGFTDQGTPSDFEMHSTAVSVSAGRRMNLGQAAVDALLGANVVLESQDADDGEREIHGAAEDFRLGAALRISGPSSAGVRAFAVGDFEASPSRIRANKYIDRALPILPWWSSGLAVGVLWGAR